jgi:hypothetical protein
MNRRLLLVLIALCTCISLTSGALAEGITPIGQPAPGGNGNIVEVTRYTWLGTNIVRHDILIDTAIAGDPQTAANYVTGPEPQASLNCQATSDQPEVVAQFCLNSWSWPESAMPVRVKYNPVDPAGLDVPSAIGPIQNAIEQWSSVTPNFSYVFDGTTTARPTACDTDASVDGINTIAWVDGIAGVKGILAQTCTVRTPEGALQGFDMEISSNIPWSIDTPTPPKTYDLYSNMLHEMGHGAGLAQSQYSSAVMYSSLNSATEKRTLTPDDIAALEAKYGDSTQEGNPVVVGPHDAYKLNVPGIIHD